MASNWAVIYLLMLCIVGTFSSESLSLDTVEEMARSIQKKLVDHLNSKMKPSALRDIYEAAVTGRKLEEVYVDGNELVAKVATNWVSLLEKKKTAVKNIVEFLEASSLNATYSLDPNVDFLNAKNNITAELPHTFGGEPVTFDQSAVQIPTDIYKEDPIILNAIKVTDGIDEIFKKNIKNDSELLWQYVGSSTGFYRSYPGKAWTFSKKLDMDQYDVRRRSWYIGAANSPKDVLILVDMSGSTSGITSNLIKVSVSEAIDTLGDDDFVNVAMFNDNTTFLDSNLTTFVQANLRNKQHLKKELIEYMESVPTEEMANYTLALEFAFDKLKKLMAEADSSESGKGAKCNSVILMFTDGGPDFAEKTIKKNNPENRTRIFVYNVGPSTMVSSEGVKYMACVTNGYFSSIPSIGAVRLTTLDYIPVLSRPLVLTGNRTYQWSNIYLDALGLGMMTTLTLPAFNKSSTPDDKPNQQLLGVVGTDVTIKGMEELVPKRRPHFNSRYRSIGPEGYAFGINSNGYILIHPRLKGQLGYLSDPPNVDLLELEVIPKGSDDLKDLRKLMIDEKIGNVTFPSLIMSNGERYLHNISMTYSYASINATSFSMAIVQPKFDLYEFQVNDTRLHELFDTIIKPYIELVEQQDGTTKRIGTALFADWELCSNIDNNMTSSDTSDEFLETLQAEIENLVRDGETKFQNCDELIVPCLLFDIEAIKAYEMDNDIACMSDEEDPPQYLMIATKCGCTHIYPEWSEDLGSQTDLQDPWGQPYFQRSLYINGFVFAVPYKPDDYRYESEDFLVTISMAIRVRQVIPAVMSVYLRYEQFQEIWMKDTEYTECLNGNTICYLIDDGGFLVSSNSGTLDVGRFFGMFEGNLMRSLLASEIYVVEELFDFQASCESIDSVENFGLKSIYVPTVAEFLNFNWFVATASWSFVRQIFYQIMMGDLSIFTVFGQEETSDEENEEAAVPGNESCIKQQRLFHYGDQQSGEGNVSDCIQGGTRFWKAARLDRIDDLDSKTNLLLVVVDAPDNSTTCTSEVLRQEPQQHSGPKPEEEAKKLRYRRRPKNCFFTHQDEDPICSGGIAPAPLFWLMVAVQVLVVYQRWV